MASSTAFLPCRIDWRPSRLEAGALLLLGLLAILALWLSALPPDARAGLSLFVLVYLFVRIRHHLQRGEIGLVWTGDGQVVWTAAGKTHPVTALRLDRHGGLVALRCRDAEGEPRHLLWWPDTLNAEQRRRLTLACSTHSGRDSVLPLVAG